MQGRRLAVQLLDQTEQAGSYSNLLLDHALHQVQMEQKEKNLCTVLFYGVLTRRITLDAILAKYSKKPVAKLDRTVRNILHIGLYQILYLQHIPDRAAVDESVKLTKQCRKASAGSFVNAVLRAFLRDEKQIPLPKQKKQALSVQYAAPIWLVELLLQNYGETEAISFLENALQPPPLTIRRNPLLATEEQLMISLATYQIQKHPFVTDAYFLNGGNIRNCQAFQDGWFHVQDAASQLCCMALGAKAGETVLDVCAAPGGKTCTIAEHMQGTGRVMAFELQPNRVPLIAKAAERLHLQNVTAEQGDATVFRADLPQADRVLCDVPCSGIGVIRRKPEIRDKKPESFADLPKIQGAILENAARYVKVGGTLLYSTCTIRPEENAQVVQQFLSHHEEYVPQPVLPELDGKWKESMVTLLPSDCNSDGFFLAKMQRVK
ncbi:MAG: 16S rRNA (cytosine(967)-C(5))-methyltransferase RsmB [Oscillospiraceae bacterium]|nr:16S rRNA (cytosine(967)-C(5))-methyltransferase RsmB [Oscillospiraceae bacterium]MDY2510537.1 16S rRNA (cytosine(967)-C(5))-methyltransferase RsmB [Ruminococcus callidus]